MIRVIIIDDEPQARVVLKTLLAEIAKDVHVIGEAASGKTGFKMIQAKKPDLVFLDVDMPHIDGFAMLRQFEHIYFDVIFTTAFSEYAIKAIKFSALDYLLKPIDIEELEAALEKYKQKIVLTKNEEKEIFFLPNNFLNLQHQNSKIALPASKSLKIVSISDIIYCEASRNYTVVHLHDQKEITVGKNLKYFEEKLHSFGFLRIHDAYLTNLSHLEEYIKSKDRTGGQVILSNQIKLQVSRNKKAALLQLLSL